MSDPTVILGASADPQRYSYLAFQTLQQQNRPFFLVNPKYEQIEGTKVYATISEIDVPIGTLSIYVSEKVLAPLIPEIMKLRPSRAIFNPGAESPEAERLLSEAGISVMNACTLVLLRTGQF